MLDHLELFKEVLTGGIYDESAWSFVEHEPPPPGAGWLQRTKHRLAIRLARRVRASRLALLRTKPFDPAVRREGADWPCFGYTMVGRRRLDHLQTCVETVLADRIPGDFAETGVWRGGSCMLVKALLDLHRAHDRCVWLADSFRGMPAPRDHDDGADLSRNRYLAVSSDQVRANFARFGLLDARVRFLEGWFADTLPAAPIARLAVLRLDGDLYHSTMDALRHLYHRVSPGGFVIVDDYGSWPSCRRAVTEFLAARGECPDIQTIDFTGVCWRVPAPGPAA